jgi:adenylosuccinate synthase
MDLEKELIVATLVVMGAQWGDEGKGKIVDILTEEADMVARYQGGHNAGHTVVINDHEYILHLIPSGILHPEKQCVIGNGVVIDPAALIQEVDGLKQKGISVEGRFHVSKNAHLIMPYHLAMEKGSEKARGEGKIGTTGRGIGPAYSDKMSRIGFRVSDLFYPDLFRKKLESNLSYYNLLIRELYQGSELKPDPIIEEYSKYAERIKDWTADASLLIYETMSRGGNILCEGAQGTLLDVDHGTYPFVTSSNATAGGACTGLGFGPAKVDHVVGVIKAYTTRVGSGPFPSEVRGSVEEKFRSIGKEYGASTGRPRRCGWFDAVVVRYSVRINSLSSGALTKLDVLDSFDSIPICTGYRYKGTPITEFPTDIEMLEACEPVYEEVSGWKTSTVGVQNVQDLPQKARDYIKRLEDLIQIPFSMISTGPKREETILVNHPLR